MTVTEYRRKYPDCEYCRHRTPPFNTCLAINKRISKRQAKKCPCYEPEKWQFDKEEMNEKMNKEVMM